MGLYENPRSDAPVSLAPLLADAPLAPTQRAIGEFVAGRPVLIADEESIVSLVLPVEGLTRERLAALASCADGSIDLFVSGTRAATLGVRGLAAGVIRLAPSLRCEDVLALASDVNLHAAVDPGGRVATAAIELAKLSRLLPAALAVRWRAVESAARTDAFPRVTTSEVLAFRTGLASSLRRVWQHLASGTVHRLLYAILLIQPIIGWWGTSAFGAPINVFWLFELPPLVSKDEAAAKQILAWHGIIGITLSVAVAIHIGAALFHHVVRRDEVLRRML